MEPYESIEGKIYRKFNKSIIFINFQERKKIIEKELNEEDKITTLGQKRKCKK